MDTTPRGGPGTAALPADVACSPAAFLVRVLSRAERAESTELWNFGTSESEPLGEVLLSHGRVCLVSLARGQITLGARLAQRHPETAAVVRRALSLVRERGRPLGDVLHEIGGVDSGRIREALLDQIADGLCEIAQEAPTGLFELSLSSSQRRLSSVLTAFDPRAIYWRTIGRLLPLEEEDVVVRCHREIAPLAGTSAVCAWSEGALFPVESAGLDLCSVSEIAKLGRQVEQLASPPALLAAEIQPSLMMLGANSKESPVLVVASARRAAIFGHLRPRDAAKAVSAASRILSSLA